MKRHIRLTAFIILFFNVSYSADFNFNIPVTNVSACNTTNFSSTLNLNGHSTTELDFDINLGILKNLIPWLPNECSNCSTGNIFPIQMINLQVSGLTSTLTLISNGNYSIHISSITPLPQNITISFDMVVDCSIYPGSGVSTLHLKQDWTCDQNTLNTLNNYVTQDNLLFPAIITSPSTPNTFESNYWEPLDLEFHYLYTGTSPYAEISFRFNNQDPITCGAVTSFNQPYYEIKNLGVVTDDGLFSENAWKDIALVPGDELVIYQHASHTLGCLNNCNNKFANFEWKCKYADLNALCQNCPITSCSINYAINYNANTPSLVLTRIEPVPLALPGNDDAIWDNSCPGSTKLWKYELRNEQIPGSGTARLAKFVLSYELNGNDFGLQQLTQISLNNISHQVFNCPDCDVDIDHLVDEADNPACAGSILSPIISYTLVVRNFTPGASIIFEFETYKCCEDDPSLYNSHKFFNQWYLRARGESECVTDNYYIPAFPLNTLFGFSYSYSAGYISSHGDYGWAPDVNLNLLFSPTVSDMSVMPGQTEGDPEEFFVQTLGMIDGNDLQLLGFNSINNSTMHGILRAKINCEVGLKIADLANDVTFYSLQDQTMELVPISCYTSVNSANCEAGDYYLYYDLSQPNAQSILQNGIFDFLLTPCCTSNVEAQIDYDVYFDLLLNYDACFSDFNDPPVVPGNCTSQPPCSTCCWLPLSSVGDHINLHCPGCNAPGVIVNNYKMYRTNLGYTDSDNNRVIDDPIPQFIDNNYGQLNLVRTNYSSQGDLLEDKLVAHFQDGDAILGYDYTTMVNNSAILDVLQLSRDIPESGTMDLQVESFTFYIDNPGPNPNPSTCLECSEYGLDATQYTTVKKICASTPTEVLDYLEVLSLSPSKNRYFFTFDMNNLNPTSPSINCAGPLFTEFSTFQKYRLKVQYKECGNFTSLSNTIDINDVRRKSEIINYMWLTGTQQAANVYDVGINSMGGPNFKMPNDEAALNLDGWTSINISSGCIPPCLQINSDFSESYVFYCETFGGIHFFVSTNTSASSWQPVNGSPDGNVCHQYFRYDPITRIGSDNFSNLFPYEYKVAPLAASQLSLNIPNGWNLTETTYKSIFGSNQSQYQPLGITSLPGVITITSGQIPPLNCPTSSTAPNPVLHYGADELNNQVFQFFFNPISNCQQNMNYEFQGPDLVSTHTTNPANCLGNVSTACSLSILKNMGPDLDGNFPSVIVPNPNLDIDFDFENILVTQNPACWTFDLTNLNLLNNTDASNVFLAVPVLPIFDNLTWSLSLTCGGITTDYTGNNQGNYIFFNIGNVSLGSSCFGTLCVDLSQCPLNITDFTISIGLDCEGISQITDPYNACIHEEFILNVSGSELVVNPIVFLPQSYDLCSLFYVDVQITSINGGFIPSLISLGTLPMDLTIISCEILNCNNPLFSPSQLTSSGINEFIITTTNLDAIGILDHMLSVGDKICIRIWFNGECNYTGDLPTLDINGSNYCGQPFSIPTITFNPLGSPNNNFCVCNSCDGIDFTTDIHGCSTEFTALVPNLDCASMEFDWYFGDGTVVTGTNSATIPYSYQQSGTYYVCYDVYCLDENENIITTCKYCEDVSVECPCDGGKIVAEPAGCQVKLDAYFTGMINCSSIEYEWDFGDGQTQTTTSAGLYYLYSESGTFNVCVEANCLDQNDNVLYTCTACEEVEVACEIECRKIENPPAGSFSGSDAGRAVASTPDGGYIIVGTVNERFNSSSSVSNESDIYVIKYDAANNIEFQRRLGDRTNIQEPAYMNERGFNVLVRPDAYYISGVAYKNYGLDHDIVVARVLLNGNVSWVRRYGYGNNKREEPAKLIDMTYGATDHILVVGSQNDIVASSSPTNISTTDFDFLAFAIDISGAVVGGAKRYRYPTTNTVSEYAYDAVRVDGTNGPEYFIVGEYAPCTNGCTDRDGFIVKIGQNLGVLGSQRLSLANRIEAFTSVTVIDDDVYVSGYNQLTGSNEQVWLTTFESGTLNISDSRLFNNNNSTNSRGTSIINTTDDKLLIAGRCISTGTDLDGIFLRINPSNSYNLEISSSTNNPANLDHFISVADNYTLTGIYQETGPIHNEIFISRIDPVLGISCCLDYMLFNPSTLTYNEDEDNNFATANVPTHVLNSDIPTYGEIVLCPEEVDPPREALVNGSIQTSNCGNVLIYPNPSDGIFNIKFRNNVYGASRLSLFDLQGRMLQSISEFDSPSDEITVDFSQLTPGIYFLEIQSNEGICSSKILIR